MVNRQARVDEFRARRLGCLSAQNQLVAMEDQAAALEENERQLRRQGGAEWSASYDRWAAQRERIADFRSAYRQWFSEK